MGVFSFECNICHRSILCFGAHTDQNKWMVDAVFVSDENEIVKGEYEGYGNIGGFDFYPDEYENFSMYHRACWTLSGKPMYTGNAHHADDQGYFFHDEDYELDEPKSKEEIPILKERKLSPLQQALFPDSKPEPIA